GDLLEVRQAADEAAAGPGRHAPHRDQNTVRGLPVLVLHQTLEHAGGLYGQDEIGVGLELQVLDGDRDGISARAELGAVDAQRLAGLRVAVDDHELPRELATLLL